MSPIKQTDDNILYKRLSYLNRLGNISIRMLTYPQVLSGDRDGNSNFSEQDAFTHLTLASRDGLNLLGLWEICTRKPEAGTRTTVIDTIWPRPRGKLVPSMSKRQLPPLSLAVAHK